MKILEFADPHCTCNSEFSNPTEDGYNEYLQLFLDSFKFVEDLVLQCKPDVLAFGGDFWDAKDYVDIASLNVGFKVWQSLAALPVPHKLAVVGNHDYFSIDNQIHTLEILKGFGWYVFEEPHLFYLDKGQSHVKIAGVPYRDRYNLDSLMALNKTEPDVVLTHCDVIGGRRRAPKSDRDSKAYSDSGLPATIFDRAGVVLNGHYHHPSQVGSNWYNVGSLTTRTFHDKNSDPRGVILYDTSNNEITRFPNPHARNFIDVHVEDIDDLAELLEEDHSGTYARIYYNLELEDEAQTVGEMFAGARLLPIARRKAQTDATTVDLRFSLEENLQRYIDEQYNDQGLKNLALEILQQAAEDHAADSSREPLEFGWLEIHNFQSIGYLKFDLRNRGLLFVQGINNDDLGQSDNGSGKSSFVEGIYWCLTGKSLRGYIGNEVTHWDEDFTRVSLEIYVGDKVYTAIRSRRDPEYKTGVKLFVGAKSAGARLSSNTETRLEDLLGRSEDNLKHVCFMTAGLANRFSRLTYSQRARLLEDIIDSKPYSLCKKIAESRLNKTRIELSHARGSFEALVKSKNATEERIAELKDELSRFNEVHDAARTQAEATKLSLESTIEEQQTKRDAFVAEIKVLESELSNLRSKRSTLDSSLFSLNGEIASMQAQMANLEKGISRLGSLKNQEVCPTCEQFVDQGSIVGKLTILNNEKVGLHPIIVGKVEGFNRIEGRTMKVKAAVSARESTKKDKCQARASCEKILDQSRLRLIAVLDTLRDIEAGQDSLNSQLVEREKELDRLQPQILKLMTEEDILEGYETAFSTLVREVFDEKGVRNSILSQVAIPYLNSRIPEYAQHLWEGRSIELSGSRNLKGGKVKNDIDIILDQDHTYKGNSSGEKRRIDLTVQLSLNDLAAATGRSRVGLLVVDEAFDTLDEPGIYAAKEALQLKSVGTVLMISHCKYAAAVCPRKLVLVKEKRYTRLCD